jgi:phosphonoacetaldehyde hydrolase
MSTSTKPKRIELVVFDWAGTTVDHGCFAPVAPFVEALAVFDVPITLEQARAPMGLGKRDHLRAILQTPEVSQSWHARHDRAWTEDDVDAAYHQHFVPRQLESVRRHSQILSGLLDTVVWLRNRDIRIGTTTGYFKEAAELCYEEAAAQGYMPDCNVSPGDVSTGRPAPWMIFRIMETLNIYPPAAVVKIGDTVPDIAEGINAGVWSVGVSRTGSEVALTAEELAALPAAEQRARIDRAAKTLFDAGAHAVIESIADVPSLIPQIEARLAAGERP